MRQSDPRDNEFVDVKVMVYAITGKAILASNIDDGEPSAVWLPKSCLRYSSNDLNRDESAEIGVKRWLAEREGLHYDD